MLLIKTKKNWTKPMRQQLQCIKKMYVTEYHEKAHETKDRNIVAIKE